MFQAKVVELLIADKNMELLIANSDKNM